MTMTVMEVMVVMMAMMIVVMMMVLPPFGLLQMQPRLHFV
jgi:hypothetical protein